MHVEVPGERGSPLIDNFERSLRIAHVPSQREREFCIDILAVRIHGIIKMIKWTGLAHGSLSSLFPVDLHLLSYSVKENGAPHKALKLFS